MRIKASALAFAILLILAGCSGTVQETDPTTTTPSTTVEMTAAQTTPPTTTTAQTTSPTPTATTTTSTTTTASAPDNPWGKEAVSVAVWNNANPSRDFTPHVNKTIRYWNENASVYGDYAVNFTYTSNVDDADIIVKFVDRIAVCDGYDTETTVGCASILKQHHTADRTETVEVVTGYSDDSTTKILKHEFGHVLGIEHGEEPMPTMKGLSNHTYLSRPDLSNRVLPWQNATLSVYADTSNVTPHDESDYREQISHALSYYERDADGHVPQNVTFARTDNRTAADITISFPDDQFDCAGEPMREGSCGSSWAYDIDTDDAYEYYSQYDIRVRGIDEDAAGWHVGYWLAAALGADSEDELPPPFVDADYNDRRDDWWD